MAINYYDDLIVQKLQRWLPEASTLRVLKPEETKKLFELTAEDNKDSAFQLPLISLSRKDDIELLSTVKSPKSYDGLRLIPDAQTPDLSKLKGQAYRQALSQLPSNIYQFNVLPIRLEYQLDIYTKTAEEGDEYLRAFLFKLVNNPVIKIEIPYNGVSIEHIANIRVLNNIANTSSITERLFSGQFTRWTIQLEIQDAFLFSIPYRKNWKLIADEDDDGELQLTDNLNKVDEIEGLEIKLIN